MFWIARRERSRKDNNLQDADRGFPAHGWRRPSQWIQVRRNATVLQEKLLFFSFYVISLLQDQFTLNLSVKRC